MSRTIQNRDLDSDSDAAVSGAPVASQQELEIWPKWRAWIGGDHSDRSGAHRTPSHLTAR